MGIKTPNFENLENFDFSKHNTYEKSQVGVVTVDTKNSLNERKGGNEVESVSLDVEYIVQPGDTLSKIAKIYGLSYQELAEYNGIADPNYIEVDQVIQIPNVEKYNQKEVIEVNDDQNIKENDSIENKNTNTKVESENISSSQDNVDSEVKENFNGKNVDIDLNNIKKGSNVDSALKKYSSELENAEYAKVNGNIFTTTTIDYINGQKVEVTHVVINDPSQINGEPANGNYASGLETASSAANRVKSDILINGSHFDYSDGSQDLKGANYIAIADGEVKTDGYTGGAEICLDNQGRLFSVSGVSAQDLVKQGVTYTFSSHSAPLVSNGAIDPVCYQEQNLYKRTCIGMVQPCEYYIVTDTTYGNSLPNTAQYMVDKGCTYARSMDQGGSVSLVRGNEVINNLSDEGERAVGDFLYFSSE